jgi:hypothetical protein
VSSLRLRLLALAAVCVIAIGGAVSYLLTSRSNQKAAVKAAPTVAQTSLASISKEPHIVFRNTALGNDYGVVSEVTMADPSGPRAITDTSCDRVYATTANYLCLSSSGGVVVTYSAHVLNSQLDPVQGLPLTGIPSRARLSHDGKLASTTSFTDGDSYAGTSFSTRTVISTVGSKVTSIDLEKFNLIHNGKSIDPVDRNYWGVTFASDDNTFYATVKYQGHTWLSRGNLATKTIETLHEDAECPSLSPDEKYIVYKQRGNLPAGQWRLVRYDIATGAVVPLAETRSVDDQVEWLNDSTVMYGLPRAGTQAAVDDVWSVPFDGSGAPKLLIPQAWSPAVVP